MKHWQKRLAQVIQFGRAWQNYLLLVRTLHAAWLVRKHLSDRRSSPSLAAAIAAVEPLYVSPQPQWRGVNEETILRFAGFIAGAPLTWGRCVQRSLLAYRLLNGYGYAARLCFGIHRQDQTLAGHAWVERLGATRQVLGESCDPYQQYLPVYTAPQPE